MKLSDSKIIKSVDLLTTIILVFYLIFLIVHLFTSSAPKSSNSIKGYQVYNIQAEYPDRESIQSLGKWFKDKVVVQPTNQALVHLRFKSYDELLSLPALLYQASQLTYWLLIGFLIFCIKKLFGSFRRDEVFTNKNASLISVGAIVLMGLPIMNWITQELFINCIASLDLNDSGYLLKNGTSLFGSETLIGLTLLAFGLTFKAAVDIKKENESFI